MPTPHEIEFEIAVARDAEFAVGLVDEHELEATVAVAVERAVAVE